MSVAGVPAPNIRDGLLADVAGVDPNPVACDCAEEKLKPVLCFSAAGVLDCCPNRLLAGFEVVRPELLFSDCDGVAFPPNLNMEPVKPAVLLVSSFLVAPNGLAVAVVEKSNPEAWGGCGLKAGACAGCGFEALLLPPKAGNEAFAKRLVCGAGLGDAFLDRFPGVRFAVLPKDRVVFDWVGVG